LTEVFRIIGKNDIHFDAGATSNYLFTQGRPPRKLSTVLTRKEVLALLPRLPLGVRPLALKHGLSVITMELNIQGTDDADMEAKEHALIETLVETDVFFSNGGTMGTKGELQIKSDGASEVSFKSVFFGVVDELDARDVLGAVIKAHRLEGLRLTLYCEENWRPSTFNHLFNGGFEFWDGIAYGGPVTDVEPDGWTDFESFAAGSGQNVRESAAGYFQQGVYSWRINVNGINAGDYKGARQDILPHLIPGVTYTLIVWIRNAAITNGILNVGARGSVSGWHGAFGVGTANPAFTRYSVTFIPHVLDTFFRIEGYISASFNGCSGSVFLDGMMVVRGTLVPDDFIEWHPNPGIRIGPNLLSNADFEEWHAGTVDSEPDCWINVHVITAGTGTNNRESTEVLQGCYSLKIAVNAINNGDRKGVRQDIQGRLVADTEYIFLVWIKNPAVSLGYIHLRVTGSVSGDWDAFSDFAANDDFTRYAVAFTPAAGDIAGFVRIYAEIRATNNGCTGWAYIDKMMVIEASVYNGHSFAPEEWTGCGWVWNHLDGICGPSPPENTCGHVNYLGIADLRGDVDGRVRIEMESLFSDTYGQGELTVARRTDPCLPCQFVHFLEAEDATTQYQWADDHVDNDRSGCKVLSNGGVQNDGYVIWDYTTLGYNLACQKGRFRVLGALYAEYVGDVVDDDIKFRLTHGPAAYQQSRWLQPLIDKVWHWLDFGVFEVTGQFWGDELPSTLYWRVDYQKAANDIVEFDFLLLIPEDESMLRIPLGEYFLATNEDALWDDTFDFIMAMKRNDADAFVWHPPIQAEPLALKPEEQNRLIFAIGHWISGTFQYKGCYVHEGDGEHMLVTLKYLPQFVSPLE